MSDLSQMRERRGRAQERLLSRANSIRNAVNDVLNSENAQLTFLAHAVNGEDVNKLGEQLVDKITSEVANPVNAFLDYMKVKGIEPRKIKDKVYKINDVFSCCPTDAPYEEQLQAVAEFMERNPTLYDDVTGL